VHYSSDLLQVRRALLLLVGLLPECRILPELL